MLMRLGPRPEAFQLPLVIGQARESGRAQYIGRGLNRWSTVHIADVVDLYLLALEKAPAGTFVFVESGEAAFRDMAQAIADALALGDPVSMTIEAAEARWAARERSIRWARTAASAAFVLARGTGRPDT